MERIVLIALVALAAPLLVALPASAQDSQTLAWVSADADTSLGGETGLSVESQARFGADGHYETILGAMVTTARGGVEFGAGYQHNRSVDRAPALREHRLRQQIGFPIATLGRGALSGRLRIEQRMRNDGDDVHLRLRPRIRYAHPLGGAGARWSLAHESFLGSRADWNVQRGLFRIRNSAALDLPLGESVRANIGYLNQVDFGRDGGRDRMSHVLTGGVSLAF